MWITFAISFVLLVALTGLDDKLWDEGGPGIVDFELAGDGTDATRMLDEWGEDGRDAARLSLWLDFPFLLAYGAFWALAIRAIGDAARRRGWDRFAHAGARLWPVPIAAAAFDALEDVALLVVLDRSGGDTAPLLAAVFATVKFVLLGVTLAFVALFLARRLPRTAVALVAAGVVFLGLNTWLVDRATEPATPGVPTVQTPAGDIHVRDEGDRSKPPVVLIHGFAVSMRWFDELAPHLGRDHRVIRLDLLGHGHSEKPRDGYSMEDQADVVAAVMERLGVRRAAVIGHSMGGIVGTALIERHPRLVSRLMMIGTPPDDESEDLPLVARLPFLPVIGHAVDTLIDERRVRNALEYGFAPEFDPPEGLEDDSFGATTYSSLKGTNDGVADYWDAKPLNERLAGKDVPVTVVMGEEEDHTERSTRLYNEAGLRTVVMEGLDHSPYVESPARTFPLIDAFAAGR